MIKNKIQQNSDITKLKSNDLTDNKSNIFDIFTSEISGKIDYNNNSLINFLLQNAFLYFKRKDEILEQKIKPLSQIYLGLNIICLIYWLARQYLA